MLVVMAAAATAAQVDRAGDVLAGGHPERVRRFEHRGRVALATVDPAGPADPAALEGLPGVDRVVLGPSYLLASRAWRPEPTIVTLPGGIAIGGADLVLMAGPCAVEDERQLLRTAHRVAAAGASLLRGGAFKPRSSPYAFQGLGTEGLELLDRARRETGLGLVTEAMDERTVEAVAAVADLIQVGSRNMTNYPLLRRAAATGKPVLLKRGMASTLDELLLAAEYLLAEGNPQVVLCERGIRGFDGSTRNVLDLTAIPLLHRLSHLPVIADPSHGTGHRDLVGPMARAAVAAGADGVMLEVHPDPEAARSDGPQSLTFDGFDALVGELRSVAEAVGRRLPAPLARVAP